jgi:hypothetical protein
VIRCSNEEELKESNNEGHVKFDAGLFEAVNEFLEAIEDHEFIHFGENSKVIYIHKELKCEMSSHKETIIRLWVILVLEDILIWEEIKCELKWL